MPRILLAVDGSDVSMRAVTRLIEMQGWWKAPPELRLMTVHLAVPLAGRVSSVLGPDTLKKYYAEEEAEALKGAREALDRAGVAYTVSTAVGDIAERIVETADAVGAELIVMGTHGRGKVGSMVLGSVAQKVLHLARAPVMLVH